MEKSNIISHIVIVSFVLICLTATVSLIILLPILVTEEKQCLLEKDSIVSIKQDGDLSVQIHLNVNKTVKRLGRYYSCSNHSGFASHPSVKCTKYEWSMPSNVDDMVDCVVYSDNVFWYGGSLLWEQQWPLNSAVIPKQPYLPGDIYQKQIGGVLERFWISSLGVALYIDDDVPLYIEHKANKLCLSGKRQSSYYRLKNDQQSLLSYYICTGPDIKTLYQNTKFWSLPTQTPARDLFEKPIWSTWAYFKQNISASSILDYAKTILNYNLTASQIEIDDKWSTNYGDHEFDRIKFPDPAALVQSLHDMALNVTLWVHPFINRGTAMFQRALDLMSQGKKYLVTTASNMSHPGYANWWRGENATLIDVTANGTGKELFMATLKNLTVKYRVDSFKFDAGEINWLPDGFVLAANVTNPGVYSTELSKLAYSADTQFRRQETRVGYRSQHLPILVRTMDKDSHWGIDNGIKALVTSGLLHSLIGYNFYLPDMIGGNAYCNDTGLEGKCYPDKELYIRWLQVATFMPAMQFSIPPWVYDNETVSLTNYFLTLRQSDVFVKATNKALANAVGSNTPIIAPMWWIDPKDKQAFAINDQFLFAETFLVAPILNKGQRQRKIYFPRGTWNSLFKKESYVGPTTVDYSVPLNEIPVFVSSINFKQLFPETQNDLNIL